MPINSAADVDELEKRRAKSKNALSDSKKSDDSVTSKKGAPGCGHDSFTPGCAAHDGVVVVAREGKTNDENKRFNATITVYSLDGTETSFVGSTIPDDYYRTGVTEENSVVVDEGIYHIQIGNGTHAGGSFYNVLTLEGSWYLPGTNYTESEVIHKDDGANGILIHRAEDVYSSIPWSEGCITIEDQDDSTKNIDEFVKLVGSSATLIIDRP